MVGVVKVAAEGLESEMVLVVGSATRLRPRLEPGLHASPRPPRLGLGSRGLALFRK